MISASIDHMLGKISDNMGDIQAWEEYRTEDADIVMLSAGLVSRSAKSAIDAARSEGIKIGAFPAHNPLALPGKALRRAVRKGEAR
jgi:2-oxoglutarate ferredoxin oxidoreductase subunit alpha